MNYILEGLFLGLTLSILLGPIFVALTQTAIEKGTKASLVVGLGIWTSDVLIITICFYFVNSIASSIHDTNTKLIIGVIGGGILMLFGLFSIFSPIKTELKGAPLSLKKFSQYWLKGFLINTINPFTIIFWTTTISQYLIGRKVTEKQVIFFLISILLTIITTDILKIILAKSIRHKLKLKQLVYFTRIAGFALFIFGIVLIIRSIPA